MTSFDLKAYTQAKSTLPAAQNETKTSKKMIEKVAMSLNILIMMLIKGPKVQLAFMYKSNLIHYKTTIMDKKNTIQ